MATKTTETTNNSPQIINDNHEQYFVVLYRKNKVIELKPYDSKEKCLEILNKLQNNKELFALVEATTIIKRDMSNFKEGYIFGCPKTYNVCKSKK